MARSLLAGASGLVGGHLLDRLLAEPASSGATVVTRRALERQHPKLETQIVDFEALDAVTPRGPFDHAYCCLGTTIKKAGSQAKFRRVDHDYVLTFARLALRAGVGTFVAVSALGADPASRVFYNRVKGETERDLQALGFASLTLLRPSLLLGARNESRPGERAAQVLLGPLSGLFVGKARRYRPISADDVARAAIRCAEEARPGVRFVESEQMLE